LAPAERGETASARRQSPRCTGLVGQYERVAYRGSKAGMIGMVRAMALDFEGLAMSRRRTYII